MSWLRIGCSQAPRAGADAQYRLEFAPGQPAAVGGFGLNDYTQHISKIRYWQFISRNEDLLLMASGSFPSNYAPRADIHHMRPRRPGWAYRVICVVEGGTITIER